MGVSVRKGKRKKKRDKKKMEREGVFLSSSFLLCGVRLRSELAKGTKLRTVRPKTFIFITVLHSSFNTVQKRKRKKEREREKGRGRRGEFRDKCQRW